jgi:hypothetical protein
MLMTGRLNEETFRFYESAGFDRTGICDQANLIFTVLTACPGIASAKADVLV